MNTYSLKFVLVGDSGVGKSQLSRRFSNKEFCSDSSATVGMEFSTRDIPFERSIIKAQIWDTAGQERFESMTKVYYRDALGALLIYDATNRASFENLKSIWLKQLKEFGHENINLVLVGNKVDKNEEEFSQRAVSIEEAKLFAEQEGMDFVETSALTSTKVEVAFRRLVLSVAQYLPDIKIHLELTCLPAGWIRVVTAVPAAPSDSSPLILPPPPPSSVESTATPESSEQAPSSSSKSNDGERSALRSEELVRSSSRSNSILGATGSLYCNYWTGAVICEVPTEPAPTDMMYISSRVRGNILEKPKDNKSVSITAQAPPKAAGRCFCRLL